MREYKSPEIRVLFAGVPKLFLAGSIEQGAAEPWQLRVVKALEPYNGVIWNPRRDDWDATWQQTPDNPQFREQVEWELDALRDADLVSFWFDPKTKSPITLLEVGLVCGQAKPALIYCPETFWRYGNVALVAARNPRVLLMTDVDCWIGALAAWAQARGTLWWCK